MLCDSIFAQRNEVLPDTTIKLPQKVLFLADSNIIIRKDTVMFKNKVESKENSLNLFKNQDEIYSIIENWSYKRKLTKEIYNIVFTNNSKKNNELENVQFIKGEDPFLSYENKIIRNIFIKKLDIFGPTVTDTTIAPKSLLGKFANQTHIKTRTYIIKNHLLFKKGDKLNAFQMAENERILRDLPFIRDARIYVIPDEIDTNIIDIRIITKDLLSIALSVDVNDVNKYTVELYNKNIFGFGHIQNNEFQIFPKQSPALEYQGSYKITNINGSFIDAEIFYDDLFKENIYGIKFDRGFISSEMKYAGGLSVSRNERREHIKTGDTSFVILPFSYDVKDMWIGRSFNLKSRFFKVFNNPQIIISARIINRDFWRIPTDTLKYNPNFISNNFYLASIGLSGRHYYKSNLIYTFGRTEDIPYGYLLELTGGARIDEIDERYYSGISFSKGNFIDNLGYFYGNITLGGFLDKRLIYEGVFDINTSYFSNLFAFGKYKFRQFASVYYLNGIRRVAYETVNLNGKTGIRGLSSNLLNGVRKFTIKLETVSFTPLNILDFRFALFGFADFGVIGDKINFIFSNRYYSGYGIGLRIRNENLVFKTFQIRFAFYPSAPQDISKTYFLLSNEESMRFSDFNIKTPSVYDFK